MKKISAVIQCSFQLFHCLFQHTSWTADIQPHMPLAVYAENFAAVQPDFGFVQKEIVQFFLCHAKRGEIQPGQVSAVQRHHGNLGKVDGKKVLYIVRVFLYVN